MAKITEDQMKKFMNHTNNLLAKHHITASLKVAEEMNNVFKERFFEPMINEMMFCVNIEYECCVVAGIFGLSHVDFYKIRRFIRPVDGKKVKAQYSHQLKFYRFAHRYCNPWIVFELEKVLFERL